MSCEHITDKSRTNSKTKKSGWRQRQDVGNVPQTKQEQQQEETERGRILCRASIRVMSDDVLIWDLLPTNTWENTFWCLQFRKVCGTFHKEAFKTKTNNWTEFIFSGERRGEEGKYRGRKGQAKITVWICIISTLGCKQSIAFN